MANTQNKKKKTAKTAAISVGIIIAAILLPIMVIVSWVEGLLPGGASDEELKEMHLSEGGLEELALYPDPAAWQPLYEVTVPYILYINEQSEQNQQPPLGAQRLRDDKEGFRKYLCYETIDVIGPNLSKYALTWQDVYTVASAIYIGELGEGEITRYHIQEVSELLQPDVQYSKDGTIEATLTKLTTDAYTEITLEELENAPFNALPEQTTEEVITITTIVTATPTPTPSYQQPTGAPEPPTPTATVPIGNTPTPTPKTKKPRINHHLLLDDTIIRIWEQDGGGQVPTPTSKPTEAPTPLPTQIPSQEPTPTPTVPGGTEQGPPSPTPTPVQIVIKEEVTITSTIEQHYAILLQPYRVSTWYGLYTFTYPSEIPEGITTAEWFARARSSMMEREDVIDAIGAHYNVDAEVLKLIPELVDENEYPILQASINRIPELADPNAYLLNLTLSQANTLEEMSWPLPGDMRLSDLFGKRIPFETSPGHWTADYHWGWDIGGDPKATIVAALAGTVKYVSYKDADDSGVYITIDHGNNVTTSYCHCITILNNPETGKRWAVGDQVLQNQPIALCGSTGSSTSEHLHFTLHVNGKRVDPAPWLVPAMQRDTTEPTKINPKGTAYREGNGAEWEKAHPK